MLRTITLVASACVLITGTANAQVFVGATGHVSDSAQMTRADHENTSAYNHVAATGVPTAVVKDHPVSKAAPQPAAARPATLADIVAGAQLRDSEGVKIGTVDTADATGVLVNTGQRKIKVPLTAFGKDSQGLLLGITAARFNELVAKAHGG